MTGRVVAALLGAALVAAQARETGGVREAFRVPGKDLLPEGIAYDPVGRAFYVGSLHRATIVRVDRDGRSREFVSSRGGGLFSVIGLRADPERRLLWVCSAAGREFKHLDAAAFGQAGLFAFDLATGVLRRRVLLAGHAKTPHLLNDLVVTRAGEVYATDTDAGRVWVLRPGSETLESFVDEQKYPNGIALSGDERSLFVAHANGISRVDLATREARRLAHSKDIVTTGIDGLYWFEGSLVGVQNGVSPERVVRFRLDARGDSVTAADVLLAGDRRFSIPTTAAIADRKLYLIANSLLDRLGEDGSLPSADRLQDPLVLEIDLGP